MYIPPRYPNAWPSESIPYENYTKRDADESMECSEKIINAIEACINEVCKNTI